MSNECESKGPFTHTINITVLVSGTFDLFNIMCKQHHRTAIGPILKPDKKVALTVCLNEALTWLNFAVVQCELTLTIQ